ncbi:hypothetical protein D9M68_913660 [compost metagenome]
MQRKQAAGEHQVRTFQVNFSEGFWRQCGEINTRTAEAGHPARRAVGFGNAFDHSQEQRWRQGVTAKAFRRGGTVDAHLFEAFDHVPRHVGAGVEFLTTLAHFLQHLLKGLAVDGVLVDAWQRVFLRDS